MSAIDVMSRLSDRAQEWLSHCNGTAHKQIRTRLFGDEGSSGDLSQDILDGIFHKHLAIDGEHKEIITDFQVPPTLFMDDDPITPLFVYVSDRAEKK